MSRDERLRAMLAEMSRVENALRRRGTDNIAGVDEAGRGPLAGPVVAAAVVLPRDFSVLGVNDSKKLTEGRREALFGPIREAALAYGVGMADSGLIDRINILEATKLAMGQSLAGAASMLSERLGPGAAIGHALIDALTLDGIDMPQTGIVRGDEKSVSIAAASIIAKVTRDRLMLGYHRLYPTYGFDRHKGYGTREHIEAIGLHGLCPIHRRSFRLRGCPPGDAPAGRP
jgi:ribonuclease HII